MAARIEKNPVKQVQIRRDAFPAVKAASNLHTTAVINHVQKLISPADRSEKPVRSRIQLPQLSYGSTLPTTDMSQRTRLRNGNLDAMIHRPVPYLSPVNNMSEASAKFARSKRIGISLCASVGAENPFEESLLRLRPRRGMISARPSWNPLISDALRPCGKIRCFKFIKTCLAYLKRLHRLLSGDRTCDQLNDRVAHMGDTQPVSYLMFHGAYDTPKFRFCSPHRRPPPWGAFILCLTPVNRA